MPSSRHGAVERGAAPPLGRVQTQVLEAIEDYVREHDRPPTVRELCHVTGIRSTSHMAYVLDALEEHGYIICEHGMARGIHLTRAPGVPIQGTLAAGEPLDLFDAGPPDMLDLAAHVRRGDNMGRASDAEYALRVRGNSMIEDGILNGDYVIVRRGDTAPEGAIVVATHLAADTSERGAATLKRLRFDRRRKLVLLCPANATLQPRAIPFEEWERDWKVQGTVTAIYRPCA
jgi:repressor LexA